MFFHLYDWIRRLAQGDVQPLPEPSIGTRRTLFMASTIAGTNFRSAPKNPINQHTAGAFPQPEQWLDNLWDKVLS